jgi:hypothetical protein
MTAPQAAPPSTTTRIATSEPLVESDGQGGLFPAGRQFSDVPRTDDRNSYGLTDAENVAYTYAAARVRGFPADPSMFVTIEEGIAVRDAQPADHAAFIAEFRASHPLPTSFSAILDGDPSHLPVAAAAPAEEKRDPDQDTAMGQAFIDDTLPDHERRDPLAAPIGNAIVTDVPASAAEELPADTIVSVDALSGQKVATFEHGGVIHHILAEIGNEWHHLIASVNRVLFPGTAAE